MTAKNAREVWIRVLNETPLYVKRRASAYLKNIRRISESEWLVASSEGTQYEIRLKGGRVTCSCPYSQQEKGYCKHVCAVATHELTKTEVMPWLKKLEERL